MPICGFCRTGYSYGLSRSRQRFPCHLPRSSRENQPASPACRVPAARPRFSSGCGSDSCRLVPNTRNQPPIFYVAHSLLYGSSVAQRLHFSVRRGTYRGFKRVKQVRMSVVRVGDSQCGRGGIAIAPVDGSTGAIDVESQPEHSVRLIELDVFRQNSAFLTGNPYTKVQIVRKVRLMR